MGDKKAILKFGGMTWPALHEPPMPMPVPGLTFRILPYLCLP